MSQALQAVDGVVEARVSFDDKAARVRYDPDLVEPASLVRAVNETGFRATLGDDDERPGAADVPGSDEGKDGGRPGAR